MGTQRHTAIIGGGPTGLLLGIALARRGYRVTVVDRDPGSRPDGTWPRRGVMQFHHAHGFRGQVAEVMQREGPDGWTRWLAAGAEPIERPLAEGGSLLVGIRSRRITFERALRAAALDTSGLRFQLGHVDEVTQAHGRASGVRVGGTAVDADLVIDASGRSGRITRALRTAPGLGGECGIAYVDRQYSLRPGASAPPTADFFAWQGDYDGYQVLVFLHEQGVFSCVIARSTVDRSLVGLRRRDAFEKACAAIPGLAPWTDPEVAVPMTDVLPGGPLLNVYRGQRRADGRLALPGLIFVGDAVCTTTPIFGRGVATSFLQCAELLRLFDEQPGRLDVEVVGEAFDAWCDAYMRPWVEDHIAVDGAQRRRWAGEDTYLDERLPSDHILAAAEQDPRIGAVLPPYLAMAALPSSLEPVAAYARAVYRTGWRPRLDPGPSGAELAELLA